MQMESRLTYLQSVIDGCKSWIEENDDSTLNFEEIMLKCLEIATDESSSVSPFTTSGERELHIMNARHSKNISYENSCSELVNALVSISKSLNEHSKKVDSLTRTQAEHFFYVRQQLKSDESLIKQLLDNEHPRMNSKFTEVDRSKEEIVCSKSAAKRNELETFQSQLGIESFSSPVDSPSNLTQLTDSVKKEFTTLNEKLWEINTQMKELLVKNEQTDVSSGYIGFTAGVSIWGPLVSPLSQFMSDANEYGQSEHSQMTNHKILTCFNNVQHNEGGHYNPDTGIFSVPVDGFYLTCLNVNIISQGPVFVGTVERTGGHITGLRELDSVAVKLGSAQSLNIFRLNKGDELCVFKTYDHARICDSSRISCFLIAKI
ncbi:hypothetical protein Btru_016236 [Bulinus truncatus]|nr:hypothetical protein Btru_016236 [Bulinus truncatus]